MIQLLQKTLLISALTLVSSFLIFPAQVAAKSHKMKAKINCDIQHHACTQTVSNMTVTLDVQPKPVKAMENLTFQVSLNNYTSTKVPFIDLGMPGMNMGRNHVDLKKTGPNQFQGQGVIVRCPSGKTIWRATVTIPQTGKVDFIFDVIY